MGYKMLKKGLLILLSFMILLPACGCSKDVEQRISAFMDSQEEPLLVDSNGRVIPVYNDVERTSLDPSSFYRAEDGRVYYKDENVRLYTGVDVSVHQGDIDWNAVKNDGVDFAMLRVGARGYGTEGKLYEDAKFEDNYVGAINAGLKVGVYYFSQAISTAEAEEEAEYVIYKLENKVIDYPVAFDWEHISYDTARTDGLDNETITQIALAFCNKIASAGFTPIIYFNRSLGYFSYDLSEIKDYHFWLAEYYDAPSFIYDYKIWQYTEKGTVNGIEGSVDLNLSIIDFSNQKEHKNEKEFN